jgi:NADH-quinone oxidoreductase subunit N
MNYAVIAPEIILVVAAMAVLLLDLALSAKRVLGWLSLVAVAAALGAVFLAPPSTPFQNMALADGIGRVLGAAVLIAAGLTILMSVERASDFTRWLGPYYALLLLAAAGMRVMIVASDLLTIFLGLEILSLALYILAGFNHDDVRSAEASLKYFLLGAFASAFFLYGIALVYGATATTSLAGLARVLAPGAGQAAPPLHSGTLLSIGMGLLIVGFGFKLALVPFHMWTPDVYQGAPTPVTGFMSVATKAAGFAAFIRVLAAVATGDRPWLIALAAIAVLTMTLGNLAALRQASLKRMLAYSSIAHAGYVLTGLAAGNAQGVQGALYYLLVYTFMNLGAFAVVQAIQGRDEIDVTGERLAGLANRRPVLAALMAVFMFSLTGIPPLAGFFGKLYVFSAAVQGGLVWLAVVAMLNSAFAAYYYLRVTVSMYMAEPASRRAAGTPSSLTDESPAPGAPATRQLRPAGSAASAHAVAAAPGMAVEALQAGAASALPMPGGGASAVAAPARLQAPAPHKGQGSRRGEPSGRGATLPAGVTAAEPPEPGEASGTAQVGPLGWPGWLALALMVAGTIGLGLWQAPWMQAIAQAVAGLPIH